MALSRLLSPDDYGKFAMASVFAGLLAAFRDGGLSSASIQVATLSDVQQSSLFWMNVVLGFITATLLVMISPLVSSIYGQSGIVEIVVALSSTFLFVGLTNQHFSLLHRNMDFRIVSIIEVVSLVLSSIFGILSALSGAKYWSLVIMSISASFVKMVLVWSYVNWRPLFIFDWTQVRALFRFGGQITLMRFFDTVASSLDSILLGRFYSSDMVGSYTRAQNLMLIPLSQMMPPLLSVSLPYLSRISGKSKQFSELFLRILLITSICSSFVAVTLFVLSDVLVRLVLGSQWTDSAVILMALVGPSWFIPVSSFYVSALTASGRGRTLVSWGFWKNLITGVSIIIGISWGGVGVSISLSITSFVLLLPVLNLLTVNSGIASQLDLWLVNLRSIFVGVFAACVLSSVRPMISSYFNFYETAVLILCANLFIHFFAIIFFKSSRNLFFSICSGISMGLRRYAD